MDGFDESELECFFHQGKWPKSALEHSIREEIESLTFPLCFRAKIWSPMQSLPNQSHEKMRTCESLLTEMGLFFTRSKVIPAAFHHPMSCCWGNTVNIGKSHCGASYGANKYPRWQACHEHLTHPALCIVVNNDICFF